MAVTKLSQIVKLNGSFRNSINLYLNLNKKEKIDSYSYKVIFEYIKTICWFCNKEQRPFYDIDWFLWQGKITFVTDSFSNSEYAAYKRKQ